MYVLGVGDHVNSGAALLKDGKLVAVVNEERLYRVKMVFGVPRLAIRKVLELAGIGPDDVDEIAFGTVNQVLINRHVDFNEGWFGLKRSLPKAVLFSIGSRVSRFRRCFPFLEPMYYLARQPSFAHRRRMLRKIMSEEFGFRCPVRFFDHHYCHATAAYYSSGFEEATIISIDGGGDGISAKVYDVAGGRFQEMSAVPSIDSLGNYYAYITQLCGFKAGRHEGKVTGLAAHGEPEYLDILRKMIIHENGTFRNIGNVFFNSALATIRRKLPKNYSIANLSSSIQIHSEELAVAYARYWLERTKKWNVALVGGLCANVRVNQHIHEIPEVQSVFVHPGMTDEGIGVGAALAAYHDPASGREAPVGGCMDHVYLGPEFTEQEIRDELEKNGLSYQESDFIESEIAQLLVDGHVVARFNGRLEYGPRALGNRSVLYAPNDPSANDWLNKALRRTEFMPFAPATLIEYAGRCYVDYEGACDAARFMTITFDCTDWMKKHCSGVVHLDGTARPQLVDQRDNPSFYKIIDEYRKRTGVPSIVNTSFNIHEEPIVCTPADAVRAFRIGHLDYLAIGNFLLENPSGSSRDQRARAMEGVNYG